MLNSERGNLIGRLLLLFMIVPLVELYVLLKFASITSIPTTFAVVLLTAVTGSMLAARQGMVAIRNLQMALAQGRVPGAEVVDGIMIVFAAALLLTPGLVTDAIGITLLIPWSRRLIRNGLIKRYANRFKVVTFDPGRPFEPGELDGDDVVDATFRRSGTEPPKLK